MTVFTKRYARQITAILECILSDARYSVRNDNTRQIITTSKYISPDTCYSVRNYKFSRKFFSVNIKRPLRPRSVKTIRPFDFKPTDDVSLIINIHQTTASVEYTISDTRYTSGNDHARQIATILKGIILDTRYAIGNVNARQTAASIECITSDARYAVGKDNARQTAASIECIHPDARYAVGKDNARQTATSSECPIPNARYTVRNNNARQTAASRKYILPDARQLTVLAECYACQTATVLKCRSPNARYAVRNDNARQISATLKCAAPDARYAVRNNNARQTAASTEWLIPDAHQLTSFFKRNGNQIDFIDKNTVDVRYRCGDHHFRNRIRNKDDLRLFFIVNDPPLRGKIFIIGMNVQINQTAATLKYTASDARYSVRNDNARQTAASTECLIPDARQLTVFTKRYARQTATVLKCTVFNACYTVRNDNVRQIATSIECIIPNTRYSFRNDNARQTTAYPECTLPDARQLTSLFKRNGKQICFTRKNTADVRYRCGNLRFRNRIRNKDDLCLFFIINNPPFSGKIFIVRMNVQINQTAASIECTLPNARYTVRNDNARQTATSVECLITNTRYSFRNNDAHQTVASGECIIPDFRHIIGKNDVFHAAHLIDLINIAVDVVRQRNGVFIAQISGQSICPVFIYKQKTIRCIDTCCAALIQIGLVPVLVNEQLCIISDITMIRTADRKRQIAEIGYLIQTIAIIKCTTPDARYATGNNDACQTSASHKCLHPDTQQLTVLAECYACQSATFIECTRSYAS